MEEQASLFDMMDEAPEQEAAPSEASSQELAQAAARIKSLLTAEPLSPSARFVDMRLSKKGLQVSRS